MSTIEQGRYQEYSGEEFVVEVTQVERVTEILGDAARVTDQNDRLKLALVAVHVGAALERLPQAGPETTLPLDALLTRLRAAFAARNGDEVLQVGKNRVVRGIQLLPYPNAGIPPVRAQGAPAAVARKNATEDPADARLGADVTVGVVDADVVHDRTATAQWWEGHRIFIEGIIRRDAPAATLRHESLVNADGTSDLWRFASALARFAGSGVKIINCSAGCLSVDGLAPLAITRAVAALDPDVVLVAAAGNHGAAQVSTPPPAGAEQDRVPERDAAMWPARLDDPRVIAVGALDEKGTPAAFNPSTLDQAGQWVPVPWIAAWTRGVNVRSTYLTGPVLVPDEHGQPVKVTFDGWARWDGTSFATAAVTAALAAAASGNGGDVRRAFDLLPRLVDDPQPVRADDIRRS